MELAVIIPVLDAGTDLAARLDQLAGERVVVSDGGSEDGSLAVAIRGGAVVALGARGRGGQLRRGCELASANLGDDGWLLCLHADTELPEGWRDALLRHTQRHPECAGYFAFGVRGRSGLMGAWMQAVVRLRELAWGLPYGDQGLFISVALYREIGGYKDMALMEDVEINTRLSGRLRRMGARVRTDVEAYRRDGLWRRGLRNLGILRAYRRGASVDVLLERYR